MKRVGIFWDMGALLSSTLLLPFMFFPENCNPSARLSGMTVALNIQRAATVIGEEISSFKAYADMGLQYEQRGAQQSELKDSGVTLVHCPHLAHKEVVDKVILGKLNRLYI